MSTVDEIKQACAKRLSAAERADILRWLREFDDEWDQQIEQDANAGKLDKLFEQADSDFESGRCSPL